MEDFMKRNNVFRVVKCMYNLNEPKAPVSFSF